MTNQEAARLLDPETSREALLPYSYDPQYQQMLLRDACELAAKALKGEKAKPFTPCDLCGYNPPSSGDGKPCSICPATPKGSCEL